MNDIFVQIKKSIFTNLDLHVWSVCLILFCK